MVDTNSDALAPQLGVEMKDGPDNPQAPRESRWLRGIQERQDTRDGGQPTAPQNSQHNPVPFSNRAVHLGGGASATGTPHPPNEGTHGDGMDVGYGHELGSSSHTLAAAVLNGAPWPPNKGRLQMRGPSSLANTGGAESLLPAPTPGGFEISTLVHAESDAQRVTGRDSLTNRGSRMPLPPDAENSLRRLN
jgi:hypothetical protein